MPAVDEEPDARSLLSLWRARAAGEGMTRWPLILALVTVAVLVVGCAAPTFRDGKVTWAWETRR